MVTNTFQFNIASTQKQILDFFQEQVVPSYIAPKRNKHIFGVMTHNSDNTVYFGPDYNYGMDNIPVEDQIVIIHDESEGLYWKDM